MQPQWEYRIVTGSNTLTEQALNGLGSDGWELVGFSSHVHHVASMAGKIEETKLVCIFKRQRWVSPPISSH